jgi:hypothetical protein
MTRLAHAVFNSLKHELRSLAPRFSMLDPHGG